MSEQLVKFDISEIRVRIVTRSDDNVSLCHECIQSGEPEGSKFEAFRAAEFDHFEVAEFGPVEAFFHFPLRLRGPSACGVVEAVEAATWPWKVLQHYNSRITIIHKATYRP